MDIYACIASVIKNSFKHKSTGTYMVKAESKWNKKYNHEKQDFGCGAPSSDLSGLDSFP